MKPCLAACAGLLPLASLAQVPLPGRTYTAKMGEACAITSTGGCLKTFFYRLHFGPDSVAVSWVVQAVCSGRDQAATTHFNADLLRHYAYYLDAQRHLVTIPGFGLAPLHLEATSLIGQRPAGEGNAQVVFELDAARP